MSSEALEHRFLEELVPELAGGVVLAGQGPEVVESGPTCGDVGFAHREELAPVGPDGERCEGALDHRKDGLHGGPVGVPGEVEGEAVLLVGGAEPEFVGGDGAEFTHHQMLGELALHGVERAERGGTILSRHEVFGLELGAGAGREFHLEVRQAQVPWAEDAHLVGGGRRIHDGDGVIGTIGRPGAEEIAGAQRGIGEALEPDMGDAVAIPVGEGADGVGGRGDGLEVVDIGRERQIDVEVLAHLEAGHDVDGDGCDDAECTETDHGAVEVGIAAPEGDGVARGGDELERGDGGGEVLVLVARAMGGGADRADDRDVRQRSEIGEGKAVGIEAGREFPVGHAAIDGDGAVCPVQAVETFEALERNDGVVAVGDPVEGVA